MADIHDTIESAIGEVSVALKQIRKIKTKQVRRVDDLATLKATAQAWFRTHRPVVTAGGSAIDSTQVDEGYATVLDATEKHSAATTYQKALREVKAGLVAMRAGALVAPAMDLTTQTDDLAPDFSPLAGNPEMREILTRRWHECSKCVNADAHLAAIVMMGGLLEALFVARANKLADKSQLLAAASAPKEKSTGKTMNYQEWMLDSYIKVGFELDWITATAKDVSDKLKEYRNFVHPAKELRYGIALGLNDSTLFWEVTKALARQLLLSASK